MRCPGGTLLNNYYREPSELLGSSHYEEGNKSVVPATLRVMKRRALHVALIVECLTAPSASSLRLFHVALVDLIKQASNPETPGGKERL